jgi:hypothetical protein
VKESNMSEKIITKNQLELIGKKVRELLESGGAIKFERDDTK